MISFDFFVSQYEIRDREKKIQEDEERRKAEESKKSPPKSPETEPDGARSPEQVSEREPAVQPAPAPLGMFVLFKSLRNAFIMTMFLQCFFGYNIFCMCVPFCLFCEFFEFHIFKQTYEFHKYLLKI